jgi:hypothetical protein
VVAYEQRGWRAVRKNKKERRLSLLMKLHILLVENLS